MQQLVRERPGALEWTEVPEPDLHGPSEALVRPIAVATCDLDGPIVTGAAPIPGTIAIGHEGIAEVVAVGADVVRAAIGPVLDLVARRRLRPELVTDRVAPWRDAATALLEPHTKLVFSRDAT